ncbi:unnamed protein product, partial [Rotaria magnacalcarata]
STLLELNFPSTFVSSSCDESLAPTNSFIIGLTAIVNQTDPLNSDDWPIFNVIWSSSFDVITDEPLLSKIDTLSFSEVKPILALQFKNRYFM